MTTQHDPATSVQDHEHVQDHEPVQDHEHCGQHGHGRRSWRMIACCIPMLVIAVVLVATGVASASFIVAAVGCMLMMALMMGGMGHGGGHDAPKGGPPRNQGS